MKTTVFGKSKRDVVRTRHLAGVRTGGNILRRSRDRSQKEEGITRRFEKKIEEALIRMKARCEKQNRNPMKAEREIGRMPGHNTRAEKLFAVKVIRRAWAANPAECFPNSRTSAPWTSCCPRDPASRSGPGAFRNPTDHQQILLEQLRLKLPSKIIQKKM